jgi:hypothetical protein
VLTGSLAFAARGATQRQALPHQRAMSFEQRDACLVTKAVFFVARQRGQEIAEFNRVKNGGRFAKRLSQLVFLI